MFILYGVLIGLLIGVVTGGSAALLGRLRFRWGAVVMLGMAAQLLLFSSPIGDALGPAAPAVYMATNGVVLAAVARNLAIPGLPLVLLGGASPTWSRWSPTAATCRSAARRSRRWAEARAMAATRTAPCSTTSSWHR